MTSPTQIYTEHYAESHTTACEAVFQAGRTQGMVEAVVFNTPVPQPVVDTSIPLATAEIQVGALAP
jgi:hypothetical protein